MNNVSFKANVEGLPSDLKVVSMIFASKTKQDSRHTLIKREGKDELGRDVFELRKDDKKTAVYGTEFNPTNEVDAFKKLLKIFHMLKIYEAENFIRSSKISKERKVKEEQFNAEPD